MAEMTQPNGTVYGIEHIPELVDSSIENIARERKEFLADGTVSTALLDRGSAPDTTTPIADTYYGR